MLRPDELEEVVGWSFPEDEVYETLAGYLLAELGRIPSVGDVVEHDGWQMAVTRMDRRRIADVRMSRTGSPATEPEPATASASSGGAA
jgi:CBS domain containing-hemolysin-like protein